MSVAGSSARKDGPAASTDAANRPRGFTISVHGLHGYELIRCVAALQKAFKVESVVIHDRSGEGPRGGAP